MRNGGTVRLISAVVMAVALSGCALIGDSDAEGDALAFTVDELVSELRGDGVAAVSILYAVATDSTHEVWAAYRGPDGHLCVTHGTTFDDGSGERTADCRPGVIASDEVRELSRDLVPPDRRLLVFRVGDDVTGVMVDLNGDPVMIPAAAVLGQRLAWGVVQGQIRGTEPVFRGVPK